MTLDDRLAVLGRLAHYLNGPEDEYLAALQQRTAFNNGWLTVEHQQSALRAIVDAFLDPDKLKGWAADYNLSDLREPHTVGLVLAGNIPLVGFHDILSVFVAGHRAQIKPSSKDPYVLPYLLKLLEKFDPAAADYFTIVENLKGFDAIIATGSNNSARYFEAYFGKYPHIIRRNRNAVAVLTGKESKDDLRRLGEDVFTYFGLGCRSVSKIYVPVDYDFTDLLEVFHAWKAYQNHTKWKNNFDYNFALLTLNQEDFLHNGAVILRQSDELASHIAGLYYEEYLDNSLLEIQLQERAEEIQLIVARPDLLDLPTFDFGQAQRPGLRDYADGVDTMAFLAEL